VKVILIFLLGFSSLFAQKKESLELEYLLTVTYTPEIINYRNTTLIVGDEFTYYNVDYTPKSKGKIDEKSDLIVAEQIKKNEYFSEILIDRQDSILRENTFDRRGTKEFLSIEENLPAMRWDITTETAEISGYQTYKANLEFRGRKYVAYFTNDVPLNVGPWKFNGLPGLIISIEDKAGIYKWKLKKIRNVETIDIKIKKFNSRRKKFKKVTYKTFDENLIKSNLQKLRIAKSRSSSRKYKIIRRFSTEQWMEPSNEYRSKTNYSM
jgi:GLPGLI family protein